MFNIIRKLGKVFVILLLSTFYFKFKKYKIPLQIYNLNKQGPNDCGSLF